VSSATSPICCTDASVARRPAVQGKSPSRTNRLARESPTKKGHLVGEIPGKELGEHVTAAFDHEPVNAAGVQVARHGIHADDRAGVHDGRGGTEARGQHGPRGRRAVDDLLHLARREEVGGAVQASGRGHGDLGGLRRAATQHTLTLPRGRPDEQARIVVAHRRGTHHDRVARRADRVDAVEVGGVRQRQSLGHGRVEIAVQ
jgi:hypothetical protein